MFSPVRFARHAEVSEILPPLTGVPGSVEMLHTCLFDPLQCRWIDEWQPTADPSKALAQTIRCYTPTDFGLLVGNTGLTIHRIEVDGESVDLAAYSYLVQLIADRSQ